MSESGYQRQMLINHTSHDEKISAPILIIQMLLFEENQSQAGTETCYTFGAANLMNYHLGIEGME